jgi:hypothetical protein
MKNVQEYADIIIRDEREKIVSETPTKFETDAIERIYEFDDGAVVRYEWQNLRPDAGDGDDDTSKEQFNHRFTLIELPAPNPRKFKKGVIKQINYS